MSNIAKPKESLMRIGRLAAEAGKGAVAGAAGTAAITVSQLIEAKVRGREPGTSAAEAVENLLDVEPKYGQAERRLNTVAHLGYGTAWGIPRGLHEMRRRITSSVAASRRSRDGAGVR